MSLVSMPDRARVKRAGYEVQKLAAGGWVLLSPRDGWETEISHRALMVGDYGCISPTEWEAYAEAIARIDDDERIR